MYFEDIVQIKESDCCDKCSSFEYDLPCRVDLALVSAVSVLFDSSQDQISDTNRLFNSSSVLQIQKDENTKIQFHRNSRYIKLCVPNNDMSLKLEVENKLIDWISKTLNIEIERKNG